MSTRSVSIDVSSVPHSVEEYLISLKVVADAPVTNADTPLSNLDIRTPDILVRIVLECLKRLKHAAMCWSIESPHISAETVGNNEAVARHRLGSFGCPSRSCLLPFFHLKVMAQVVKRNDLSFGDLLARLLKTPLKIPG